jgi:hypothetical protein
MSMIEKIIFNEDNNEFAFLHFGDRQLVIKIDVRTPNSDCKAYAKHCTPPLTREQAIKKAKEIYANRGRIY